MNTPTTTNNENSPLTSSSSSNPSDIDYPQCRDNIYPEFTPEPSQRSSSISALGTGSLASISEDFSSTRSQCNNTIISKDSNYIESPLNNPTAQHTMKSQPSVPVTPPSSLRRNRMILSNTNRNIKTSNTNKKRSRDDSFLNKINEINEINEIDNDEYNPPIKKQKICNNII
eukprot:301970_1